MEDDNLLLKRIRNNDQKALEQLFQKYYYSLCYFAKSFVKNADLAEEIVSDVFFNIWQGRYKLNIQNNFRSYIFIAIRNHSLKAIKKEKVSFLEIELVDSDQRSSYLTAESSLQYKEMEKRLEAIIETLPSQRKLIFKLNRLEGLKYKEIADKLHISVNTVQKQMVEAVRYLSEYEHQFFISIILFFASTDYCFFNV